MNAVIDNVRINGKPMSTTLSEQIIGGSLKLSSRSITAFDCTIQESPDMRLTGSINTVLRKGTTVLWQDYALSLSRVKTGGGAKAPTIDISATSDFVHSLQRETGGKSWGKTSVSAWAGDVIRAKGAKAVVQPGLGEREIKRKEPEGNGTTDETTWDVLAEMAKQTGAWLFEYGNTIYLAKPSWLVAQSHVRRYPVVWNSWTDHTDALVAAPEYSWEEKRKKWEGEHELVIRAMDPGPGSTNPLSQCRPGDIVDFTGLASPSPNPLWLVVSVNHPLVVGAPVTITCWRPEDPPEILPDSDKGEGGDDNGTAAGVPKGPIGANAWQGEQLKMATEIVKEGQRRKLPQFAWEIAVMVAMGESSLRNTPLGDNAINPDGTMNDSMGLFQQQERFDTGGHSKSDRMSPGKSAGIFYAALVKINYAGLYNNGGPSVIHGGYYGPGKSATSASLVGHNIQRNQNPNHYAHLWADAQLVVKAILDAGRASGGSAALTGPLGKKVEASMKGMEGKLIEFDGAFMYQCVDVAKQYVADLTGIRNAMGNGNQWWMNPSLSSTFSAIPVGRPPRKGDIASWAGNHGAYPNGGVGHVAIYSHSSNGQDFYLSQNPGPARIQPLNRSGVQGWMRPKG